ncbi:hypothetical protein MCUN1_003660 [Malassezia cuniculi]|uniref:Uncharacterized protein n=1 Tax=Malassezia cuniculi TaxID=948313 RepID=A0AAF0F212_9BASI|nr:hypothetical protein MCUN1_003660 [Malassezia cuniculi]
MDPLVYAKNNIEKHQRIYQADIRPVYQRLPGSKLYFGAFLTVFTVGMIGITGGAYNMITGKKRE